MKTEAITPFIRSSHKGNTEGPEHNTQIFTARFLTDSSPASPDFVHHSLDHFIPYTSTLAIIALAAVASASSSAMFSWAKGFAAKVEIVRSSEAKLLEYAKKYAMGATELDSLEIKSYDTPISRSAVPWRDGKKVKLQLDLNEEDNNLFMHGVHIHRAAKPSSPAYRQKLKKSAASEDEQSQSAATSSPPTSEQAPLVLIHGYMNAAAYFYRNIVGLSRYFDDVYSLDLLGWGLSSRPNFMQLKEPSIRLSEAFFVESLEAWRVANSVDKMVLVGHSMGGYLSVAYCEKYPENVERLVLLSPVGVNDASSEQYQAALTRINSNFRSRMFFGALRTFFYITTPAGFLRFLPHDRAYGMVHGYIERRLPEIENAEERKAVAEYLFHANTLPGSGEHGLQRVLTPTTLAKEPLQHRIPNLKIQKVSFFYGDHDWMDSTGGLMTRMLCEQKGDNAPEVDTCIIDKAGHLLMLQNWQAVNAGIILAGGGKITQDEAKDLKFVKLDPNQRAAAAAAAAGVA